MSRNAAPARERCSAPRGAALTSSLSLCHRSLPCTSLPTAIPIPTADAECQQLLEWWRGCFSKQLCLVCFCTAGGWETLPAEVLPLIQPCPCVPGGGCFGRSKMSPSLPAIAGKMWPSPAGPQEPSVLLSVMKKTHVSALTPSLGAAPSAPPRLSASPRKPKH